MNGNPIDHRRPEHDRRKRPTRPWDVFWSRGRRGYVRRTGDRTPTTSVDRFPMHLFALGVALLALTIADGLFTVILIEAGFEEANPVMKILLDRGVMWFIVGKYLMTAAFLPVALVYCRASLFGTRWQVGSLIPVVVGLYVVLITYQVVLIRQRCQFFSERTSRAGLPGVRRETAPRIVRTGRVG